MQRANKALVEALLEETKGQRETLEDDLFILRLVSQQQAREGRRLADHIDLHKSLLLPPSQRLSLIAPRIAKELEVLEPDALRVSEIALEFPVEGSSSEVGILFRDYSRSLVPIHSRHHRKSKNMSYNSRSSNLSI